MHTTQTVESLIAEIAEDLEVSEKDRIKLFNYMLRFIRELKSGIAPDIRYWYYDTIPSNFAVELPEDFDEYIMIGIIVNGVLIEQSRNQLILRQGAVGSGGGPPPGAFSGTTPQTLYGAYYQTGVGSNMSSDMRGLRPRGEYGSFDIDKANQTIIIDPYQYVPNLYLMYKSNCIEVGDKALVHTYAQNAAILYTKYNYCRDRYNDNRHQKYEVDMKKAMRDLPGLLNPISLKDCIDSLDLVRGYLFAVPFLFLNVFSYF